MYQGQATLVQENPQLKWVFWGVGGGILLLTAVAMILLPAHVKRTAAFVGAATMLVVCPALSRSFKPKLVPVNLYVDQSGIYAYNAPLVRREDITQAYIRPAFDKQVHRMRGYRPSMPFGYYRFHH